MKSRERRQWWVRTPNTEHRGRDANRQPVTRELKHKENGKRGSTTATAAKAIMKKMKDAWMSQRAEKTYRHTQRQANTRRTMNTVNQRDQKRQWSERCSLACVCVCGEREGITEKSYTSLSS